MSKITNKKKQRTKKAVILAVTTMLLSACQNNTAEVNYAEYLTPQNTYNADKEMVRPQLGTTDYTYWTEHKINASTDMFWDMATNTGSGCGLENFTYYTQIVTPQDAGLEMGYPTEDIVKDMMTERQVLFTMGGYELGEWSTESDGSKQCYDAFKAEVYQTTDITGRTWDFFLYDYTLKSTEDPDGTHSFNLFGITTYYDDWLTIELTGTNPVKNTDTEQLDTIMEIYAEFSEIYGFTGIFVERPSNEATAHYLLDF